MPTIVQLLHTTSTPAYVLSQSLAPWGNQADDGFEQFLQALAMALGREPVRGAVRPSDAASVARAAVWFAQAATQPLQATLAELGDYRNLRTEQLYVEPMDSQAQCFQRRPRLRLDVLKGPYGRLVVETNPLSPNDFTERSCLSRRNVLFAKNRKDWDSGEYLFEPADADAFYPQTDRQFQVYSQVLSLSTLLRDLNRVADVTVGTWPVRIGCGMVFQDPTVRLITNLLRVQKSPPGSFLYV